MLGVLRMLATAETVMKHIVSQVMVLADGIALAFAGGATGLRRRLGTGHGPLRCFTLPAAAGLPLPIPLAARVPLRSPIRASGSPENCHRAVTAYRPACPLVSGE